MSPESNANEGDVSGAESGSWTEKADNEDYNTGQLDGTGSGADSSRNQAGLLELALTRAQARLVSCEKRRADYIKEKDRKAKAAFDAAMAAGKIPPAGVGRSGDPNLPDCTSLAEEVAQLTAQLAEARTGSPMEGSNAPRYSDTTGYEQKR